MIKKDLNSRKRGVVHMSSVRSYLLGILGVCGSFITHLIGGWNSALETLLIFMVIDILCGVVVGALGKSGKSKNGALSSPIMWCGLAKKLFTIILVVIATQLDAILNIEALRSGTIIAFIANETISIVENAGLLGVPMPNILKKAIDILKSNDDNVVDK